MGDGQKLLASALAAALAETVTLPIDVCKTRLQTQAWHLGTAPYKGMVQCMWQTIHEEGAGSLWKGLKPALVRQICYSALALQLYEPILDFVGGYTRSEPQHDGNGDANAYGTNYAHSHRDEHANSHTADHTHGQAPHVAHAATYLQRLVAGGAAGALAICVFNPTEVLKTQMQNASSHLGMLDVLRRLCQREGILGLWAGVGPNVTRTFLVNAAELGTYDHAKTRLLRTFESPAAAYIGASFIAGLASACISTPADVVKTRLMQQAGSMHRAYSGILDAVHQIFADEGLGAFYSGFAPILCRKLLWCTLFFYAYEQLRTFALQRSI